MRAAVAGSSPRRTWGRRSSIRAALHAYSYRSDFAGTNKATVATWSVGEDFDSVVDDLHRKGVRFEQYDLPGTSREGDIHTIGEMRGVWVKDPDGNIISIVDE